jgi:hypothetical protein
VEGDNMKQNDIQDNKVPKLRAQNLENLFNIYQLNDGSYFYNITKTTNFPGDLDPNLYFEYVVQRKDTWPIISWKHYSDVTLWWVICSVNGIINPVALPTVGTVLKILNASTVRGILADLRTA